MGKGIGALSFIAGLGTGYLNQSGKMRKEAKDDEDRELRNSEIRMRLDELKQGAADKQALRDAGAQRTAETGVAVQAGTGTNFYKDPAQAAQAAADAQIEAEMRGDVKPVTATPATGITIQGAKTGNQITTQPVDVAKLNAPDERNKRVLSTLWRIDPSRAIQMEASLKQGKMADIQISEAEAKQARETFNAKAMEAMRTKGIWQGAASILTDTASNGLDGVEFRAEPTPDGKIMQLLRINPDGSTVVARQFPNTPEGEMRAVAGLLQTSPEKLVDWYRDDLKATREAEQWNKRFDWEKKKHEDDQTYRNRALSIQAGQEKRARELHEIAMKDAKIPGAVKMRAQNLAKESETVQAAIAKAMAEDTFRPDSEGGKKLLEQQARLSMQMDKLLKPYIDSDAKGAPKVAPGNGLPTAEEAGFGKPAPKAAPVATPGAKGAPAPVAAQGVPPAYVPPPGSPAAIHMARQQAMRAEQVQREAQMLEAAQSAAAAALQSGDPAQAEAAQQLPGFSALPIEQKAAIRQIVFGR